MPQKLQIDRWLFSETVGLALFGVVMVYSASAVRDCQALARLSSGALHRETIGRRSFVLANVLAVLFRAWHRRGTGRERAGPGHRVDAGDHLLHDLFCRRDAAATSGVRSRARGFVRRQDAHLHSVSHEAPVGLYRSLGRFSWQRLSGGPIADRGWLGRYARTGIRVRPAEAFISAPRPFGFHFG